MSVTISGLPPAASLTGAELVPVVQDSYTVRTTASAIAGLSSTSFANPTASVTLTAANGVATTAMRSDAAPPLDQSIAPAWTGAHTFSSSVTFNGTVTIGSLEIGYLDIPQNIQDGDYTFALGDRGEHVYQTTSGIATTWTIPANASVPFPVGSAITLVNDSNDISIEPAIGVVLVQAGNGEITSCVLSFTGMATLLQVAVDRWYINGVGLTPV